MLNSSWVLAFFKEREFGDFNLPHVVNGIMASGNRWIKIKREGKPAYYIFIGYTRYGDGTFANENDETELYSVDTASLGCL